MARRGRTAALGVVCLVAALGPPAPGAWAGPVCEPNQLPPCERSPDFAFARIYCSSVPSAPLDDNPGALCGEAPSPEDPPTDVHDYVSIVLRADAVAVSVWVKGGGSPFLPVAASVEPGPEVGTVIVRNVDSRFFPLITNRCWRDTEGFYLLSAAATTSSGSGALVSRDWVIRIPRETAVQDPRCI